MSQRASVQVCKCASVQVCKCASVQVCKCASVQVCRRASVQVRKCVSVQVVSYIHLTLSTNYSVYISLVAVAIKKNQQLCSVCYP